MVLVVEGYTQDIKENITLEDCMPLIEEKINEGLSTKEAIKVVASENNINKKELYQFYHNEKGE